MTAELLPNNPKSWTLCATCCERVYNRSKTIHNECNWCRKKTNEVWAYYNDVATNPTSEDNGIRGISRVKNKDGTFRYWLLRMVGNGKRHAKVFSDSTYGSEELALKAAKEYRARNKRER